MDRAKEMTDDARAMRPQPRARPAERKRKYEHWAERKVAGVLTRHQKAEEMTAGMR